MLRMAWEVATGLCLGILVKTGSALGALLTDVEGVRVAVEEPKGAGAFKSFEGDFDSTTKELRKQQLVRT